MFSALKIIVLLFVYVYSFSNNVQALPDLIVSSFSACWVPGMIPKNDVVFKSVIEKNIGDTTAPAHKSRITPLGIDLECVSREYINYFEFNVPALAPGAIFTPSLFPLSYNSTCGSGWMGLEYLANSNYSFQESDDTNNSVVINPVDHCSYSCSATFTPSSGTVSQGQNFDLQGKITNINAGGLITSYAFMWATAGYPGSYNKPPTVEPAGLGTYVGQWNSTSFAPKPTPYNLVFLMTLKNLGWNHSVTCNGKADVMVTSPVSLTPTPTIVSSFDAWFQTKGGDVYSGNNIVSKIPGTAVDRNFSQDLWGVPGLIIFGGNNFSLLPSGNVSIRGWLANYYLSNQPDFNLLFQKLGSPTVVNWDGTVLDFTFPPGGTTTILYTGENIAHVPAGNYSGGKLIILSKADIVIEGNIVVSPGSFLAAITPNKILIQPSVARVEGIYIAGGNVDSQISTGSEGENQDAQLVLNGTFYSNNIKLERSLPNLSNKTIPAESFAFRPDFIVNAPFEIFSSSMSWQEVTP